jgi:hypothetical protein
MDFNPPHHPLFLPTQSMQPQNDARDALPAAIDYDDGLDYFAGEEDENTEKLGDDVIVMNPKEAYQLIT